MSFLDLASRSFQSQMSRDTYHGLVARRKLIIENQEESWQHESRVVWLDSGDENIKCFNAYSKG